MEKFYKIKENLAEIVLPINVYPLVAVKKALSNFLWQIYTKLHISKENIIIEIVLHEDKEDLEKIIGEFYNECLREYLRYSIAMETKNLRELIVGRALYTTCIEIEEDEKANEKKLDENISNNQYKLDEIAVNWFDKYNKEEKRC